MASSGLMFIQETDQFGQKLKGGTDRQHGVFISLLFFKRKVKTKVKLSLCLTKYSATKMDLVLKHYAMEDIWGSGGIAPHILNLGDRWRSVVSFTSQPLCPWKKSPRYSVDRLGVPQSHSLCCGKGEENPVPARSMYQNKVVCSVLIFM
jgi:hypothetical protein